MIPHIASLIVFVFEAKLQHRHLHEEQALLLKTPDHLMRSSHIDRIRELDHLMQDVNDSLTVPRRQLFDACAYDKATDFGWEMNRLYPQAKAILARGGVA